jgi:SAM-dependent methyltransferase
MSTGASSLAALTRLVDGLRVGKTPDSAAVKSCCAAAYGVDLVTMLLGESYHPGGAALTRRLADTLHLESGAQVLDVASGIGTTALLLAAEYDVHVVGIDLGDVQVATARTRAMRAALARHVRFEVGDAEYLPADDASFDAAVCECAFCTFPDKPTAAAELARVVRPGGRVGISDVWLDPDALEPELAGLAGRIACLADARPIAETRTILEAAGLVIEHIECHDQALLETIEQIENRLRALRMIDLPVLRPFNLRRGIHIARRAADVVRRGDAGYTLITATSP